jgi:NADP-dependent 3-hydroxy acid dehydrogenase YdfG
MQAIVPHLAEDGTILLTNSIATSMLLDGHAVYAPTKATVEAFSRTSAIELAPRRIRVKRRAPRIKPRPLRHRRISQRPDSHRGLLLGAS